MKRKIFTVLMLALFVCAYGCGGGGGEKDADAGDDGVDAPTPIDVPDVFDVDVGADPDVATEPELPPDVTVDISPDTAPCNPLQGGECSVIDNCGCGGSDACRLVAPGGAECSIVEQCLPNVGTLPTGAECTPAPPSSEPCAVGNACLTSSLTSESKCYKFCDDDSDCEPGRSCSIPLSIDLGGECGVITLSYKACDLGCPEDAHCNPFDGTGCSAPNDACLYDTSCGIMFCAPSSDRNIGDNCEDDGLCPIGAECLSAGGGEAKCYELCDNEHPCDAGTCSPFSTPYEEYPGFGACIE